MLPIPGGKVGNAICEKYFPVEEWERSYTTKTGILKRISAYSGFNFEEILNLPYSYFLLLSKESWIDSYMQFEDTREILKNLWRLQQTEADLNAVRKFEEDTRHGWRN